MTILVAFRKTGSDWDHREYADDMLQTLMDRANQAFGDPNKYLGGPSDQPQGNAYDRAAHLKAMAGIRGNEERVGKKKPRG